MLRLKSTHAILRTCFAAPARTLNLTIVSGNVRDFVGTGVVVHDPWNGETHRMELI